MIDAAPVAEFVDPWEAELARHYLADLGIEAWLEGTGPAKRLLGEGSGRLTLFVPQAAEDEARSLLAERLVPDAKELGDLGEHPEPRARRPMWVGAVAALVAAGLIVAAVPRFLWVPILLLAFAGFLLWRTAGPRRPY